MLMPEVTRNLYPSDLYIPFEGSNSIDRIDNLLNNALEIAFKYELVGSYGYDFSKDQCSDLKYQTWDSMV
jgi:hypothetical protein